MKPICFCMLVVSTAIGGFAAEVPGVSCWPMLGGTPSRNMANPLAKGLPATWSIKEDARTNIKWSAVIGNRGYVSPTVAGGKVFICTNNANPRDPKIDGDKAVLMCFDAASGKFLWHLLHDMPPREIAREASQDGMASVPVADGNLLYYVTPAADVICASMDGKIVWHYDMFKNLAVHPCYMVASSPLVVGDWLFVVTGNGTDAENMLVAPDAPSLVAFNKKTGKVLWKDHSPGKDVLEGQWSSPTFAEVNGKPQVIYAGGDGWLRGFEPDTGKLIWKFDCNPKKSVYKPAGYGNRNYIVATPVVHDNKVYVGTGIDPQYSGGVGHFWCVDITKTGDLSPVNDNFNPADPVNKNSGLVWHYGGEIVPRPKNGRDVVFGRTISTAAVHDGLVYISEVDGYLHCLDAKTGKKYWEIDLKAGVWGSPFYADGKVYLGTDDAEVNIIPHGKTPPKKEDIVKIDMERAIKAPVVAVGDTLYVTTDTHVHAIRKK